MAPVLTPISNDAFIASVRAVADRLAGDGWAPSVIVGVGRGGLVPGVFLSHATGVAMVSIDRNALPPGNGGAAMVALAERTRAGERLLVIDDINDTGRTIAELRGALADVGAVAGQIRFATLIDNIRSSERVDYAAREIDRAVTKDWFVFPWEAMATTAEIVEDAAAVPERTA